ncbi:MAG: hypothetical protein SGJ05_09600 [bacterium]|nr:hypothetical protein [bacterium]
MSIFEPLQNKPIMFHLLLITTFIVAASTISAQITGEDPQTTDSVMVFEPAEPLIGGIDLDAPAKHGIGMDLLFSASGWGIGGFFQRELATDFNGFLHLGISGHRNTDEFENAWLGPIPVVSNKVNRLFMVPFTIGAQYRMFHEELQETFRPFVSLGITPTYILATPYIRDGQYYDFFESFGHSTSYVRLGGVFGVGSFFGSPATGSLIGVQLRYFLIPFGGNGIESVRSNPIRDFGGIFLSLTVGHAY